MNSNLLSRLVAVGLTAAAVLGFGVASASAQSWGANEHVKIMAQYGSEMLVVDDEIVGDEHEKFNLSGAVFGKLSRTSTSFSSTLEKCVDEVRTKLIVQGLTYASDRSATITAHLKLYEGASCFTTDLDGVSDPITFKLKPGESVYKFIKVENTEEGGDYSWVGVNFGAVLGAGA